MIRQYKVTISGKVQGVFFRASTRDKAVELSLEGYVRNLPNGDVFIEVRGEDSSIDRLVKWCWKGPMLARVSKISKLETELTEFDSFEIRR